MDAEIEAHLDKLAAMMDRHFAEADARMRVGFGELGARMDRLEGRMDALEGRITEGFLGVADRLATMQIQLDQLDARLTTRIADVERRTTSLWSEVRDHQLAADSRMDALTLAVESLGKTVDLLRERVDAAAVLTEKSMAGVLERTEAFRSAVVESMNHLSHDVLARLDAVEKELVHLSARVDGLSADMLQRFRNVNDRLGEIDRRLAA